MTENLNTQEEIQEIVSPIEETQIEEADQLISDNVEIEIDSPTFTTQDKIQAFQKRMNEIAGDISQKDLFFKLKEKRNELLARNN